MTNSQEFLMRIESQFEHSQLRLVWEFFIAFSRFEFALKSCENYLNPGRNNKAEANWDRFASDLSSSFDQSFSQELDNAVKYLLKSPPKIQKVENNKLKWEGRDFNNSTPILNRLKQAICDTRNNLFHGGKFETLRVQEVARDSKLIESCLVVLNHWLEMNEEGKSNFFRDLG